MAVNGENELCFTWTIEDFSFCTKTTLFSPEFAAEGSGNKWQLLVAPNCFVDDTKSITQCILKSLFVEDAYIDYKLEMIDACGRVLRSVRNENELFNSSDDNILCTSILKIDRKVIDTQRWSDDILRIRCYIKYVHPKEQVSSGWIEASTKIGVDRKCFEIFLKRPAFRNACWVEEIFKFESTKFQLIMSMPDPECIDELDIKCDRMGEERMHRYMSFQIALYDRSKMDALTKRDFHLFNSSTGEERWTLPVITNLKSLNIFNKYGDFTIRIELSITSLVEFNKFVTNQSKSRVIPHPICKCYDSFLTLQKDFRKLFEDKKYTDVKLNNGHMVFPVHKSILSARSPVFKAMLEQGMIESERGEVDVDDADDEVLKLFLEYLYTGTVRDMDYDCAKNLLFLSNKYLVLELREECSSQVGNLLSVKNACEVFTIAELIEDEKLKKCAFDYMTSNAEELLPLPEWSEWMKNHSELSNEILLKMVLDLKRNSKKAPE